LPSSHLLIRELVINDPLGVQLLDKGNHVGANFPWRREDELFARLEMNEYRDRRCDKLSTGMKQKVSIARTLMVTGEWWSGLIVRECFFGTRRFDDFQRRLDIAPNILSQRLQRLVQLGIIAKVADDSWAVRHEYRLTDKGADLYHVPLAILTWGQRWLGAAQADTTLTHIPCGADLEVVLSCGVCAEPMTRDTIALADDH